MHEEDHDQLNREKGMEQPQKEQFFSGLSDIFLVWPEMVQPIPGPTQFVPEWAAPFQAKINLSQNGLHHIRKRLKTSRFFGGFHKFLVSIFCF